MKVFIVGGTGFVGTLLSKKLLEKGHHVTALARGRGKGGIEHDKYHFVSADAQEKGSWQQAVRDHDAVINLAGVTIFRRWNPKYKQAILDSRILTTRRVVEALPDNPAFTFINTSAAGYYGFAGDEECPEDSPPGNDFLAQVCQDWEAEAREAEEKNIRMAITRFGVVLQKSGGALSQMVPAFKMGMGGPLGSGKQWFSWIHANDLTSAFLFILEHKELDGVFNFVAPNPVTNKGMTKALGKALQRPAFIPVPGFMLKMVMGEFGDTLLHGQRAVPKRLLDAGFTFKHPEIQPALEHLLKKG
ncbi:MAG: TIGR01777 family oxidoreductase [Desulfatibacillum sp.]|nr:TIGR01777 family oxidoreductase [Desulfatibacillum sp.]